MAEWQFARAAKEPSLDIAFPLFLSAKRMFPFDHTFRDPVGVEINFVNDERKL
jgi:hypothetical protein